MVGEGGIGAGPRRWVLVMNRKAGTAARGGSESLLAMLRDVAGRQGVQIERVDPGGAVGSRLRGADRVIAAGGDGTVTSVASELVDLGERAPPMAVLPLGTFNNFAGSIGMPAGWEAAVDQLPSLAPSRMDVGFVQGAGDRGHYFLNVVTLGVHPAMVKDRDARLKAHPQGRITGKWPAMLAATWRVLRRFPRRRLTLELPELQQTVRTPGVYVCRDWDRIASFGIEDVNHPGELAVWVGKTQTRLGSLWLALRAAAGRMPGAEGFDLHHAPTLTLSTRRPHHLDLAIDGEHVRLKTPISFSLRLNALRVLRPRPHP